MKIITLSTILLLLLFTACSNQKTDLARNPIVVNEDAIKSYEITVDELYKKIQKKENIKLLDVREQYEYDEGHIQGAILNSVQTLAEQVNDLGLEKDDEIIIYCRSGQRSTTVYAILKDKGYTNIKSLEGGLLTWEIDGYPVEK